MKTIITILLLMGFFNFQIIQKIEFKFQSTFSPFPDEYVIDISNKLLIKKSQIKGVENSIKKLTNKRAKDLSKILTECDFENLSEKTEHQVDGSFYYLTLHFSDNRIKKYKAWDGYASNEYKWIHNYLRNIFEKKAKSK